MSMPGTLTPFEAFEEAVRIAGGQAPFARLVGCSQGNIWQLLEKKRPLSAKYVLKAESGTGVSRHDLAPEIYPRDGEPPRAGSLGDLEPAR